MEYGAVILKNSNMYRTSFDLYLKIYIQNIVEFIFTHTILEPHLI